MSLLEENVDFSIKPSDYEFKIREPIGFLVSIVATARTYFNHFKFFRFRLKKRLDKMAITKVCMYNYKCFCHI